jgi:hypothetical protein
VIQSHSQLTKYPILWFISVHPEKCQDSLHKTCRHHFISRGSSNNNNDNNNDYDNNNDSNNNNNNAIIL